MPAVDPVLLQLKAQLGTYSADVTGAADASEKSFQRIQNSASQTEKSLGTLANNSRISQQILQHVARSTADSFAAGTPPLMIFSTHIGQLAEAAGYAGGSLGKFGEVMAGPVGIGATIAVTTILPLIVNLLKAGSSVDALVDKMREHYRQSQENAQANQIFANTVEGVAQALEDNRKAQEQLNLVQDSAAEKTKKNAEAERERALAIRDNTVALLKQAEAEAEAAKNPANYAGAPDPALALRQGTANAQVYLNEIRDKLAQAQSEVAKAEYQITQGQLAQIADSASKGPEDQIKDKYDKQIDGLRRLTTALISGADVVFTTEAQKQKFIDQTTAAYKKQVDALVAARDAEIKNYQAAHNVNNAQTGREITPDQAAAIARAAGLQVNSVSRTYGQQKALYDAWVAAGKPANNPVAVPGTSAHEGAKGRWALDIQLGPGITPDLLRKVFAAQGVNLTKVFKEQGHFHVEGSRSQADAADTAAEQAAAKAQRQDDAFSQEKLGLDKELIDAKRRNVVSADEQARYEVEAINAARDRQDAAYTAAEVEGKIGAGKAEELIKVNDQVAAQKVLTVILESQAEKAKETLQLAQGRIDNQAEIEEAEARLAKTVEQQKESALRLLDLQQERERLGLEALIRQKERDHVDDAELALAKERLNQLGQLYNLRRQGVEQQYQSPIKQYLSDLDTFSAELDRNLGKVAANGLDALNQGIVDAITGAKSLGDAFKGVADQIIGDLLRIAIQEEIIKPLANALFGGSGSNDPFSESVDAFQGGGGGIFGSIFKTIGGLFRASGGPVSAGRPYVVGENGPELLIPQGAGTIISNAGLNGAARPAGAQAAPIVIQVELSDDLNARVVDISSAVADVTIRRRSPAIVAASVGEVARRASRPRI